MWLQKIYQNSLCATFTSPSLAYMQFLNKESLFLIINVSCFNQKENLNEKKKLTAALWRHEIKLWVWKCIPKKSQANFQNNRVERIDFFHKKTGPIPIIWLSIGLIICDLSHKMRCTCTWKNVNIDKKLCSVIPPVKSRMSL